MDRAFHPVADIFPMLDDARLAELSADIKAHGLHEPIWLHADGRIIDGRNRYRACQRASVEPQYRTWAGEAADLVPFVVSLNLHRRHLNESQRAMVASKIATLDAHRPAGSTAIAALPQPAAAKMLNVSVDSIQRARQVQDHGAPALVAAVEAGTVAVSTAAAIATLPEPEQAAVVAAGEKAILREAKEIKQRKQAEKRGATEGKALAARLAAAPLTPAPMPERSAPVNVEPEPVLAAPATIDPFALDLAECLAVHCCDVASIGQLLGAESVDVILTDPPYPRDFLPVYEQLAEQAARVLRPGGSLFAMVGQSYLPEIMAALCKHLTYQWTLAYLTPGGQAVQLWQRKVNTFWKPVLWFTRGTYEGPWLGDVSHSDVNDNDKRHHEWGQSESGMLDLVRRCSVKHQTILDPFCGAGTTGVAALAEHRRFIGCDLDQACVDRTRQRCEEVIRGR